jgi:hypothetical protein
MFGVGVTVANATQNSSKSKSATRTTEKVDGLPETTHLPGNFFFDPSTLS